MDSQLCVIFLADKRSEIEIDESSDSVASFWGKGPGGFTTACDLPSLTKDDDWVESQYVRKSSDGYLPIVTAIEREVRGSRIFTACVVFLNSRDE